MVDDQPGGEPAQRRADPLRGGDRPLRHIVAPGAAHQIGHDQRRDRPPDPGADPVEQLHADQPCAAVGKRVENRPHRQDAKPDQKDRLAPPAVGGTPDEKRDRQHNHLCGDNAGRHHRRRPFLVRECQLLPDQRQERRVGEMKQHRAAGIKQQRAAGQQHFETRWTGLAVILLFPAPRPDVVDRAGRDRQHGDRGEDGKERDEEKDCALRQCPADDPRGGGDRDVPAVIEGRVAAHATGQRRAQIEPQGQRRDCRAEHVADDRHQAVGNHHRPEIGRRIDRDRPGRQHRQRGDDQRPLGAGGVDQSADRDLHGEAEQPTPGRHQPDGRLAPILLGDEKDVEIGAERAAHIGQEEIQGVERGTSEWCSRRGHRLGRPAIDAAHAKLGAEAVTAAGLEEMLQGREAVAATSGPS